MRSVTIHCAGVTPSFSTVFDTAEEAQSFIAELKRWREEGLPGSDELQLVHSTATAETYLVPDMICGIVVTEVDEYLGNMMRGTPIPDHVWAAGQESARDYRDDL